ncbi:MAG: glycoside hydrolase family 99-like domain-containing protein, partial [Clostridia bacterium]|nr:glycoside hydrolase family 99-like domain-containing protein [Clostridia bacterium]
VNEAFKFMDEELKAMGYDGLILLYQTQSAAGTSHYTSISNMGFDSTYGYHWGTNGWNPDHQINANTKNAESSRAASSHHIPTISIGFNDVGRNNTRDKIITAEDHLKVAENMKEILSTYNTGTWKDNTIMVSTWNEYSEGTYVMPTDEMGFAYLENIRKVFTNDTSDHSVLDTKPTQTQIDRVGHMYAPNHSPIRWFQFEKADSDTAATGTDALTPVVSYDMKNDGAKYWENQFGIDTYSEDGGVIKGTANQADFAIKTSAEFEGIEAEKAPVIHVRIKASAAKSMEVFFITDTDSKWNDAKRKLTPVTPKDEFVDYYINMSSVEGWNGNIEAIRIDPTNTPGTFEIDLIELMNYKSASETAPRVKVNGAELEFVFAPSVLADGDYEVVGEARRGFYSALRLYYEWDRFTDDGVLTFKTYDEHTYVFKINSDKVTVDGVEKNLGFTLKQRDGMPVFHMKKLAELLGYKVVMNGTVMEIQASSDEEYKNLTSRVENQWEFNLPGATEGFRAQQGSVYVGEDGRLSFTATGSDVAVQRSVNFKGSDYTPIVVGIELIDPVAAGT